MLIPRLAVWIALPLGGLTLTLLVGGCQSVPLAASNDTLTWNDRDHEPEPALVLDAPPLHDLIRNQPDLQVGVPWYAGRLDRTPSVQVGYHYPSLESSLTLTRDRQITSGDRVHDHFDRTSHHAQRRRVIH
jgi:hypothetical protein